jgi:hypothetical protein
MLKAIVKLLTKLGRKRIILDRQSNEPYLERYYVFLRDRTWFPFNVFLHKFLKSDPDDVHDHPWPYATLILKGGYYESVPIFDESHRAVGIKRYWRGPGHFRICRANSYHRIEVQPDVECWTLFMPGPQKREWGFLVNNQWVHNDEYIRQKTAEARK